MSDQNPEVVDPNAPPAAQPAQEAPAKPVEGGSVVSVFIEKLKEQGFTVMLMCGILYYQHNLWMNERAELIKEVDAKEERILTLVEREHANTLAREAALREKRDQFVEALKQQAAECRAAR